MRRLGIALLVFFALAALWSLQHSSASLSDVLREPWQLLRGSQQELNSRLIDVSENPESVRAAGRRLLKPLGSVRLIRTLDPKDEE